MGAVHKKHPAVILPDESVVVFGGEGTDAVERWKAGIWSTVAHLRGTPHTDSAATLPLGRVLVLEGSGDANELYDPAEDSLSPTGSLEPTLPSFLTTTLSSGRVMILGDGAPAQIYVGPE